MKDRDKFIDAATDNVLMRGKGIFHEFQHKQIASAIKTWVVESRYYQTTPLQLCDDFINSHSFRFIDGKLQIKKEEKGK